MVRTSASKAPSKTRPPRRDRRHIRHEATRREILDLAWRMVRAEGLNSLSLSALARAVGMEPQSLYTYFESKHAVYDAMFSEANKVLLDRLTEVTWPSQPRPLLRLLARTFIEFSAEDQARHHLLFDRIIPDFQPTPHSYGYALQVFDTALSLLATAGVTDPADIDLWTALVAGLASQQMSNDPGGDRWLRLTDRAVDMYATTVLGR